MESATDLDPRSSGQEGSFNGGASGAKSSSTKQLPQSGKQQQQPPSNKKKSRRGGDSATQKRRCVSTACIACRRRKSKCDGALPSCAACASVYGTECVYDPNSDHRRKGVYKEKVDSMKAGTSTLRILIEAILNATEDEVPDIVRRIRTCDSLDVVAEQIIKQEGELPADDFDQAGIDDAFSSDLPVEGERELARKMGELRLENGAVRFIGGTSHLLYLGDSLDGDASDNESTQLTSTEDPILSWTTVTTNKGLINHLLTMYFNWHYPYFTTLSRTMFFRDYMKGRRGLNTKDTTYCSSLLVNAMLALGCHFTSIEGAYGTPGDSRTKGDHFFAEAKRLIIENDEYEKPRLTTVQALALMSVREAGCAREAKGWVYSGMSFRMAQDIGLNFDDGGASPSHETMGEHAVDARRMTFWGCFLFDKCWSNYLGRLPQIPKNSYNVPKYDVFPQEDAEMWSPYTDGGFEDQSQKQPSRTRAIGLQLSKLCEISSDLLIFFYHPNHIGRSRGKAVELKKLSELHRRLEDWRKELPKELEPKEGQLPNMILVHMFFHLQYIHLFRPFLKYTPSASPLPSHVSPRRICTANAGAISKLMRLYKKTWNLRQICNIAVYMVHSACTIHMLNLPEKTARRDITHGIKHLEEIAEDWLCGRRTLSIISVLARKWNVELPEEAEAILQRTDEKYGSFSTSDIPSPKSNVSVTSGRSNEPGGSPAAVMRQEQYCPMDQFVASSMSPGGIGSAASDMLMANSSLAALSGTRAQAPGTSQTQQQQQMPHGRRPGPSPGAMPGWQPSGAHPGMIPQQQQQPRSKYPQQPFQSVNSLPGDGRGMLRTNPASPSQQQAFGGLDNEWLLDDSVRWQQNFDAWTLGPGMDGQGQPNLFMFQSGSDGNGVDGSAVGPAGGFGPGGAIPSDMSASGSSSRQGTGMSTRQGSEDGGSGFEGLNSLSNASGWLPPGLD